jgi:hypothetical protein
LRFLEHINSNNGTIDIGDSTFICIEILDRKEGYGRDVWSSIAKFLWDKACALSFWVGCWSLYDHFMYRLQTVKV